MAIILVPNNETFSLQTVCDAINWHELRSDINTLQECFDNARSNLFDATYNDNSYAPADSLLRFRNYGFHNTTVKYAPTVWSAPAGVYFVFVECQGGGGAPGLGGIYDEEGGGGGGGAACIGGFFATAPYNDHTVDVGSPGNSTSGGYGEDGGYSGFYDEYGVDYIRAGGGWGGDPHSQGAAGGSGGASSTGLYYTGTLYAYGGGNGGNGSDTDGGGGGGGAGSAGDGDNATGSTPGGGGGSASWYTLDGGTGGFGATELSENGSNAYSYGGGGGAPTKNGSIGVGYQGRVVIHY